jgi:hypothetical protein
MSAVANPYAPPRARVDDVSNAGSEAEEIRQEHIKHEASVRSVGVLYYIGGVFACLGSIGLLATLSSAGEEAALLGVLAPIYLVFGVLSIFVGRGLRKLRSWARITTIVLSVIGLLGFPVGTLVNGYILYLMASKKGKRIFESDYADIVEATPHIKYRTSVIVWIVLGLLLVAVVGIIAAAVLGGK